MTARIVEVPWPHGTGGITTVRDQINAGEQVAFRVRVPTPDPGGEGSINLVEGTGGPLARQGWFGLSADSPSGSMGTFDNEAAPRILFRGDDPVPTPKHGHGHPHPVLPHGDMFLVVSNDDPTASGGVIVTFQKPRKAHG